jgi:hypothetical protein
MPAFHVSKMVRTWIREHNQQVKQSGTGVRILPFLLPKQCPWLNPIERKAGSMASTLWLNQLACCRPSNWLSGSVRILDARMNLISLSLTPERSFENALGNLSFTPKAEPVSTRA